MGKYGTSKRQQGGNFRKYGEENYENLIGTKLITLLGVLVLHDCIMVVFQNNLSMKPLVIAHSVVSEHVDVPHQHSKGNYAKFCRFLFQKRL